MPNILETTLWTEGFRPKRLEEMLMVKRVRALLTGGLKDNLLFSGTQGIGKTTVTRILSAPYDTLTVNASLERGIDTIREKIMNYCASSSLLSGHESVKVVVLEECDNMTEDAWKAMRPIIEQFHKTVRFIANCNYENKIPAPILSRFTVIHLDPINSAEEQELIAMYVDRTYKILNNVAKIQATPEAVKALVEIYFPDMRSIVKKCQELKNSNATELTMESLGKTYDNTELFDMLVNAPNPWDNYKYMVSQWSMKPDDAMLAICRDFPEYLRTRRPDKMNMLPYILKACANYQDMMSRAIDKLIPLLGLTAEIQIIINRAG